MSVSQVTTAHVSLFEEDWDQMKLNEPETHKLGQKSSRQVKYVSYILTWWWIFPRVREVLGEYSTIDSPPAVFFFFLLPTHKKKKGGGRGESLKALGSQWRGP